MRFGWGTCDGGNECGERMVVAEEGGLFDLDGECPSGLEALLSRVMCVC